MEYDELIRRVVELERRLASQIRNGTVHSVDPVAKTARLRIGGTDDDPFLSPPVPYAQTAGALKIHTPPSIGQPMTMLSPSGDHRQASLIPATWSDANPSPSDKGDEHILTFGSVKIAVRGTQVRLDIGGASLDVTDSKMTLTVGGTSVELSGGGLAANASGYDWN